MRYENEKLVEQKSVDYQIKSWDEVKVVFEILYGRMDFLEFFNGFNKQVVSIQYILGSVLGIGFQSKLRYCFDFKKFMVQWDKRGDNIMR